MNSLQQVTADASASRRRYQDAVEQNGRLEARIEAFNFSSQTEQSQLNSEIQRRDDTIQKLRTQLTSLHDTISRQQNQVSSILCLLCGYFYRLLLFL